MTDPSIEDAAAEMADRIFAQLNRTEPEKPLDMEALLDAQVKAFGLLKPRGLSGPRIFVIQPGWWRDLSWAQRLLSWPWRPWQKKRWQENPIASTIDDETFYHDKIQNVLYCTPAGKVALDRTTSAMNRGSYVSSTLLN